MSERKGELEKRERTRNLNNFRKRGLAFSTDFPSKKKIKEEKEKKRRKEEKKKRRKEEKKKRKEKKRKENAHVCQHLIPPFE